MWIFSFFILLWLQASAFAQSPATTSDEWEFLVFQEQDGTFSYCVTQNNYNNGTYTLLFARQQQGEIAIVLRIAGGQLRVGQSVPLTLRVDNSAIRKTIGVPTTQEIMNIDLGVDEDLYSIFMTGLVLYFEPEGDEDTLSFTLTGTKYALARLKTCSDNQGEGFPNATLTEEQQVPEVPTFIAQAIGALGMHTYPLVLSNNAVGWGFGPIIGFIEGVAIQEEQKTDDIVSRHIDLVQERCNGDFEKNILEPQSVTLQFADQTDQIDVQRGSATCTTSEVSRYIGWVFQRSPEFFFVYTMESDQSQQQAIDRTRDAISNSILELLNETLE